MRAQAAPPALGAAPRATPAVAEVPPVRAGVHRPAPEGLRIPEACVLLPADSPERQWRRGIPFAQTEEDVRIGSEVVDQFGEPFRDAEGRRVTLIEPETYPHPGGAVAHTEGGGGATTSDLFPEDARRVCPVLGRTEVWEVVNETRELHNFHIHQARFRLARAGDAGAPPGLTPAQALTDPTRLLAGLQDPDSPAAALWHDVMPVAPRGPDGTSGRIVIAIPFTAPEQVGRFLFHCHVLEHEDQGMMAPIEVLAGVSPTEAASGAGTHAHGRR
jgi:FtsP/CotA-like multicopper oxidase with cupredoxin domain